LASPQLPQQLRRYYDGKFTAFQSCQEPSAGFGEFIIVHSAKNRGINIDTNLGHLSPLLPHIGILRHTRSPVNPRLVASVKQSKLQKQAATIIAEEIAMNKQEVLAIIDHLPDQIDPEQLMTELYLKAKLDRAEAGGRRGRSGQP
jgi:hypothetical protein